MISRVALSTKGLLKRYGKTRALDGFTLDVPAGAILGLVALDVLVPSGVGTLLWRRSASALLLGVVQLSACAFLYLSLGAAVFRRRDV